MDTSLNCHHYCCVQVIDFFFGLQHGFTEIYPTEEKRTMPMGGYSCDIEQTILIFCCTQEGDGGILEEAGQGSVATSINLAEPRFLPCSCQGRENQNFPITHR